MKKNNILIYIYQYTFLLILINLKVSAQTKTNYNYPLWLNDAIIYQIYPQSFKDSDGDGIGDIEGLTEKLPYIKSIGVNTLWLNPIFSSSFMDAGYDIDDYYTVAPRYGTNQDLESFIQKAHAQNLKVCLDLVAGHTSTNCQWFKESAKIERNKFSERYIWTNSKSILPKNFVSAKIEKNGNYLKNFFDTQPALNYGYANPNPNNPWEQPIDAPGPIATREALKEIISFWVNKGVDGFRVDMASSLVKNDKDFTETYKLWNNIRTWFSEKYPEGALLAEWSYPQQAIKAGFMLDFMIHFNAKGYPSLFFETQDVVLKGTKSPFFSSNGGSITEFLKSYLYQKEEIGNSGLIVIPTANHDFQRLNSGTRNTPLQLKTALTFLLTWQSVPCIYYGDEIGMRYINTPLPDKEGSIIPKDIIPYEANRAGSRTPMQWDNTQNAGFSSSKEINLYLPIDPHKNKPTVEQQENDTTSILYFTKQLLKLRKENKALGNIGKLEILFGKDQLYPLVYKRSFGNDAYIICVNPKDKPVHIRLNKIPSLIEVMQENTKIESIGKRTNFFINGIGYAIYKVK